MRRSTSNLPYYQESDPRRLEIFRNSTYWASNADMYNNHYRYAYYSPGHEKLDLHYYSYKLNFFCKQIKGM